MGSELTFNKLAVSIHQVHEKMAAQAGRAINMSLTMRNWLIGAYITEYEQHGTDRAKYGERLIDRLAEQLKAYKLSRIDARELRRYRLFYQIYPQIRDALTPELQHLLPSGAGNRFLVKKRESTTPKFQISGQEIISKLSFTHIAELLKCEDNLKRAFYEIECIRGNWSVRELKRQIASLYYERSSLSKNKKKLAKMVQASAEVAEPKLAIRDPYVFEFLGLRSEEVMSESHLESQLLDKLQKFLLELGNGFCFEARQKRILINDSHYFIDLVFYHRILKCHVLVELKLEEFSHENIGQLNTYVTWYKKNMMTEGDNPPVGILLCTQKDSTLVEYALAGMDNQLFVSKYQLELPKKEEMQRFIAQQIKEITSTEVLGYGE